MKNSVCLLILLAAGIAARAQELFPERDSGETRSRSYHVLHYNIAVALDDSSGEVRGNVTTRLIPFLPRLDSIVFDAEEMRISSVTSAGGKELPFDVGPKTLVIHLPRPAFFRDTVSVSIAYSCKPRKGLYFTRPDSLHPSKPTQIWTQGEDMDSHFWFPCYDFPNDFATSELSATVRSDFVVLSNGRLVGVKEGRRRGTKTYRWREDRPHVTYLTMLAAGRYAILKDHAGTVPLEYYVYPGDTADARVCFSRTPDMVNWFSRKIGFAYPWEKYAQVLIADFIEGGMENVSATSLMDEITVFNARTRVDESSSSLIAHELAHQWWGDVITCKNWRHLWLNEGFASYFDPLYHEHWLGEDQFHYLMYEEQQKGIRCDARHGRKPIVSLGSYTDNLYARSAAVLHMLRYVLGDSLFWRAMHAYIVKHQFTPVETNDLKTSIEESTGQSLGWFFDEWVYRAGYPVFDLSTEWNDTTSTLRLRVRQSQQQDSLTGVFRTPVDIEIRTDSETITRRVDILTADTTFVFPVGRRPLLTLFDPEDWLLKEVRWEKPRSEWELAAATASNPVERIHALKELTRQENRGGLLHLFARAALHDRFWAVREFAVSSLESVEQEGEKDSTRTVLLRALTDQKSAVRSAAARELAMFEGPEVVAALRAALRDSSYHVVAGAIFALAKVDSTAALPIAISYLDSSSYHDIVANTALVALAHMDTARAVAAAFEKAEHASSAYSRYTALEILKKHRKGEPDVTNLFVRVLTGRNEFMKSYAARSLGEIGDPSVIPALSKLAGEEGSSAAEAARESIEMLKEKGQDPVR